MTKDVAAILDPPPATRRVAATIRGAVQGVGFRPFVYRIATECRLSGWVNNFPGGVALEVEGALADVELFFERVQSDPPPASSIHAIEQAVIQATGGFGFSIHASDVHGERRAVIQADLAICRDCLRELFDPADRRHRYPFINCTHCGPRFSIIEGLPYDRAATTMRHFRMCPACRDEYENPANRRFHAQPNACPNCGPQLSLWNARGSRVAVRDDALRQAATAIRVGEIVAIKGLGGFHLVADARNPQAVGRLRARKHRVTKPFAIMAPGLDELRSICLVSHEEAAILASHQSPILLLRRQPGHGSPAICGEVAPHNPLLGAMLPYTPLHALIMKELGFPIVATSGNLSEEPICFDENDALNRLGGIADWFLVHDRPIARPVEDSILRVLDDGPMMLRRARGYAPLPVTVAADLLPVFAVGGQLKNTVAIARGREVFIGPHCGDLDSQPGRNAFEHSLADLRGLYHFHGTKVACDEHPDYASTRHACQVAARESLSIRFVQHHHAHVAACMAENNLHGTVLGVAWDGSGYGADETIWGGEFLAVDMSGYHRIATIRSFRLPGGETAVREPRRSALGVLHRMHAPPPGLASRVRDLFSAEELRILQKLLGGAVNSPLTTSLGRLFDAAAAVLGICMHSTYEGEAAMMLEFAAMSASDAPGAHFTFPLVSTGEKDGLVADWDPAFRAMAEGIAHNIPAPVLALRFHRGLARMIADVAQIAHLPDVVLTGGSFQNVLLLSLATAELQSRGFRVHRHHMVPPNDGGIAFGQVVVAGACRPAEES